MLKYKKGPSWSCKVGSYLCKSKSFNHEKGWACQAENTHLREGQGHNLLKPPNSEDRKRKQRGRTLTENLERVKKVPSIYF